MIKRILLVFALLGGWILSAQTETESLSEKLEEMSVRSIGPAGMSGRVTTIDVVREDPNTIYIGTASGGLWKSTSGGTEWEPIFDDQASLSIGAVAIAPSNREVLWVGTGEGNPRNSQSSGRGVFKSLDGGAHWTFMGLPDSRNIHRILIDPRDENVVYVGAQGPAWGESEERGVFKTIDGGATWERILYVNDSTGVADMVMDPINPNKIIVSMWQFKRWPWFFKSGGEGSGLYVTYNGGADWEERTEEDGLPKGELGRMGLAIAPGQPQTVYALIEAKKNGLYRSDDGGFNWSKVSEKNIGNRPFYYADLYVDPSNENRIFNLYSVVSQSDDGGKTFRVIMPYWGAGVHPDHHAWYIHPDDPDFMINGNDGGMAITRDGGETWRFVENLPLAQYYHINVDNDIPYNVYGGMQDNGSWKGPGYVWKSGGIRNSYWQELYFGDGFDVVPDPTDYRYAYAMSQEGNVARVDTETGETQFIQPQGNDSTELRFHWNAAIAADPFEPNTIYFGSQYVHKSADRGASWEVISPDLSSNDPEKQTFNESGGLTFDVTGAENHTTVLAIEPSTLKKGLIWASTDDGRVHITQDGGANWTSLEDNIPGLPVGAWMPQIKASRYDEGTAFLVVNDYRRNDWAPYLYKTTNYGKSWKPMVSEEQVAGHVTSFLQDPKEPRLMWLGSENGLYFSIDEGENWEHWTHDIPNVQIADIALQEREGDLVLGTFGRAAFVIDDIRPMRALAQEGVEVMEEEARIFDAPTTYLAEYQQAAGTRFAADAHYKGDNRYEMGRISYIINAPDSLKNAEEDADELKPDTVTVKVYNANSELMRNLYWTPKSFGLNRGYWYKDRKGSKYIGMEDSDKPREFGFSSVLPGAYTLVLHYGEQVDSASITVAPDPRLSYTLNDYETHAMWSDEYMTVYKRAVAFDDRMTETEEIIGQFQKYISSNIDTTQKTEMDSLKKSLTALKDSLHEMQQNLSYDDDREGYVDTPDDVEDLLGMASYLISTTQGIPAPSARLAMDRAEKAVSESIQDFNTWLTVEFQPVYDWANSIEFRTVKSVTPLE